jgi:ferrous iron transport protein A
VTLGELSIGDRAEIIGYLSSNRHYRKKLLIMGLIPGTQITLLRTAPLGDPIEITSRGLTICLRKGEAQIMQVEKISK